MKKTAFINLILILSLVSYWACKKQDDWLNKKTNKSDVVPETVTDFQALLDNTLVMNDNLFSVTGLVGTDNISVREEDLGSVYEYERNLYLWQGNYWEQGASKEWSYGFQGIEFANLVLEGLAANQSETEQYKSVKGQALFFRALSMYNLVQLFCKSYVESTAGSDLGLPIRETADVNIIVPKRASLKDTYGFMVRDLQEAVTLLPTGQPYTTRPDLTAAKAMLAKIYLAMEDYTNAAKYADEVLSAKSLLLDFNDTSIIDYGSENRFILYGTKNPEILFYGHKYNRTTVAPVFFSVGIVADDLYNSYADEDLRKLVFYTFRDGANRYVGSYTGTYYNFTGIATNEIYLIAAECAARTGNREKALNLLNRLLVKRYKTGTFIDLSAASDEQALTIILQERRKEVPFTGNIRWEDLKRLNHDPRFQKTLTRKVGAATYTLAPNDKRYVLPIPDAEIQISGIEQNN